MVEVAEIMSRRNFLPENITMNNHITGVIIQARTGSTRLPSKILMDLPYGSGVTVLEQVIRRVQKSKQTDIIVIATTKRNEDDIIIDIAKRCGAEWFRGSSSDVLSRYYHAATAFHVDTVVRVTSDCPCIDPVIIDRCITSFVEQDVDYLSNTLSRSFPHGLDVEVFSFKALSSAFKKAVRPQEREHVTPFIISNNKRFSHGAVSAEAGEHGPEIRITLDTLDDYMLLCLVFDYLYQCNPFFGVKEIVSLFRRKPFLNLINRKILQKRPCNSLEEEFSEALRLLELQELNKMVSLIRENRTYLLHQKQKNSSNEL